MVDLKKLKIGLGTWMLKRNAAKFSTLEGIKIGYRHVDTAQAYGNEEYVGEGLQESFESGLAKRDEISIATKLHPLRLRPKAVLKSTEVSLKKLKLDYVDILYVHYPAFVLGYSHKKTLGAISQLVDEGKVKKIGVSNFTIKMINEALEECDKPIFANQVEHHPYLKQERLIEHHQKKNVLVVSYSPLGRGHALKDPIITEIAEKNRISQAQVNLAWVISKGAFPIPKATSLDHLKNNYEAINKIIPIDDLKKIDKISKRRRYVNPPVVAPKEWKE
jgi:2,5-diketo-D-gluconate reductase B